MTLTPVISNTAAETAPTTQPKYPARTWTRTTWLKRAVGAFAMTIVLGLGACGGEGPGHIIDDDDDIRYAGGEPAPNFWCSDEEPEWLSSLYVPGSYEGYLCGEQDAWAGIQVDSQGVYSLTLASGIEDASLAIFDPDGEQVAQLDMEMPSVNIEMGPGQWSVAATANDPTDHGWSYFTLAIEAL